MSPLFLDSMSPAQEPLADVSNVATPAAHKSAADGLGSSGDGVDLLSELGVESVVDAAGSVVAGAASAISEGAMSLLGALGSILEDL